MAELRRWLLPALLYLALGISVCGLPTAMPGEPNADVWNHVWGYWWWAEALANGDLPLRTGLLSHPGGGVLYYVDPLGALLSLPLTWTVGPAFAYWAVQVGRIVFCGLAAQALALEIMGDRLSADVRGPASVVSGVAYATTPYLLCELANGITELMTLGWVPVVLLAFARARHLRTARAWVLLGVAQGVCTVACFYYGVGTALLLAVWYLCWLGVEGRKTPRESLGGGVAAAVVAVAVAAGPMLAMRWSVQVEGAMIMRPGNLNKMLMDHNAVDPRIYFKPGDFQTIDLLKGYGEYFVHTAYLRWSVLLFAALGVLWLGRRAVPWVAVAVGALVLGLGNFLYFDHRFVVVGSSVLWLPFGWIQSLVPDLAITHPIRLAVPALAVTSALAGAGLAAFAARMGGGRTMALVAAGVASVAVAGETAWGSVAAWPVPTASTHVPDVYSRMAAQAEETGDRRAVLDLPAEVDSTMATTRYLWYQTVHGLPVPYVPHVRARFHGDDGITTQIFPHGVALNRAGIPVPHVVLLMPAAVRYLAENYGWIVYHPDWDEVFPDAGPFRAVLKAAFGEPLEEEGMYIWQIPTAEELGVSDAPDIVFKELPK